MQLFLEVFRLAAVKVLNNGEMSSPLQTATGTRASHVTYSKPPPAHTPDPDYRRMPSQVPTCLTGLPLSRMHRAAGDRLCSCTHASAQPARHPPLLAHTFWNRRLASSTCPCAASISAHSIHSGADRAHSDVPWRSTARAASHRRSVTSMLA